MNRRQREKQENELANNCVTILATLIGKELGVEAKQRKDGKPFVEFLNKNGKAFIRIDVLVRMFENEE